jgi:hypothetical protein
LLINNIYLSILVNNAKIVSKLWEIDYMPKISEVIQSYQLPSLNKEILDYFQSHSDEIFSAGDAESLGKLLNYSCNHREIVHAFWDLYEKELVSKERVGKWVYFGSKEAIDELKKHTRPQKKTTLSSQGLPVIVNVPEDIPMALTHTLQVIHLVKKNGFSRINATIEVAKKWNIARQTIQDKYCRQLGVSAAEIDKLLKKPDIAELKAVLKNKYPEYQRYVDSFFSKL